MQLTPNFRLMKPDGTDPVNVQDLNDNMDVLDAEVVKKLDKTGDASNVVNKFTQAGSRTNLLSGEKLSVSFGKIMKWFVDLKDVAFSGRYSDLTDRPTIPAGGIADKSKIIDNLDDIAANTQTGYMAGALAVKELNQNLGGCALAQEGNDFYIVGADAVRKKLGEPTYNVIHNGILNGSKTYTFPGYGTAIIICAGVNVVGQSVNKNGIALSPTSAYNSAGRIVYTYIVPCVMQDTVTATIQSDENGSNWSSPLLSFLIAE